MYIVIVGSVLSPWIMFILWVKFYPPIIIMGSVLWSRLCFHCLFAVLSADYVYIVGSVSSVLSADYVYIVDSVLYADYVYIVDSFLHADYVYIVDSVLSTIMFLLWVQFYTQIMFILGIQFSTCTDYVFIVGSVRSVLYADYVYIVGSVLSIDDLLRFFNCGFCSLPQVNFILFIVGPVFSAAELPY